MGEKGTLTRRHILDSACPLFIRHGYKAVTMQDICRASGLSKGGLYRHYKDKSSLFPICCKASRRTEGFTIRKAWSQIPLPEDC